MSKKKKKKNQYSKAHTSGVLPLSEGSLEMFFSGNRVPGWLVVSSVVTDRVPHPAVVIPFCITWASH